MTESKADELRRLAQAEIDARVWINVPRPDSADILAALDDATAQGRAMERARVRTWLDSYDEGHHDERMAALRRLAAEVPRG